MDDKQLAKLIKKNVEKAEKLAKARTGKKYDSTLPPPSSDEEVDAERDAFFKEMKKREF